MYGNKEIWIWIWPCLNAIALILFWENWRYLVKCPPIVLVGTGNVLKVQTLLHVCSEHYDSNESDSNDNKKEDKKDKDKDKKKDDKKEDEKAEEEKAANLSSQQGEWNLSSGS